MSHRIFRTAARFQIAAQPPPAPQAPPPVDRSITKYTSDWIVEKNLDVKEIIQGIYDRTNKQYGTNEKPSQ